MCISVLDLTDVDSPGWRCPYCTDISIFFNLMYLFDYSYECDCKPCRTERNTREDLGIEQDLTLNRDFNFDLCVECGFVWKTSSDTLLPTDNTFPLSSSEIPLAATPAPINPTTTPNPKNSKPNPTSKHNTRNASKISKFGKIYTVTLSQIMKFMKLQRLVPPQEMGHTITRYLPVPLLILY